MYMKSEIWKQSIDDGLSAYIDYGETEATILYGVRLEKDGNNYSFFIAYEGDFYRKMPPNYVDTILELGWRKGLCQLLVDRCQKNIEARQSSLDKQLNAEAPDQKEIDRLGVVISNLEAKRDKYAVQL